MKRLKIYLAFTMAFLLAQVVFGQQSEYYQRAAQLYRTAAEKESCPQTKAYLVQMADWNSCMVDVLAGRKSSSACGTPPSVAPPPCEGTTGITAHSSARQNNSVSQMQADQAQAGNAVQSAGNLVLDIIQSGNAKRQATSTAFIQSFARDLYKKQASADNKYFYNATCAKCNGKGTVLYDVPPGDIIYGQSHMCEECNGLGVYYRLKQEYLNTKRPVLPEIQAFEDYLIENADTQPCYEFWPDGYKGSVKLIMTYSLDLQGRYLMTNTNYNFKFKNKKGAFDINATLDNTLVEQNILLINEIQSVQFIPEETKYDGNTKYQVYNHIALEGNDGQVIEMTVKNYGSSEYNILLNNAKVAWEKENTVAIATQPIESKGYTVNNGLKTTPDGYVIRTLKSGGKEIVLMLNYKKNEIYFAKNMKEEGFHIMNALPLYSKKIAINLMCQQCSLKAIEGSINIDMEKSISTRNTPPLNSGQLQKITLLVNNNNDIDVL